MTSIVIFLAGVSVGIFTTIFAAMVFCMGGDDE